MSFVEYLLSIIEVVFHAFDCKELSWLYTLSLDYFAEGAFSFFADQSVV